MEDYLEDDEVFAEPETVSELETVSEPETVSGLETVSVSVPAEVKRRPGQRIRPPSQHPKERQMRRAEGLMRRLVNFGMATEPDEYSTDEDRMLWKRHKMMPAQVQAVTAALKKVLPDLQATTMEVIDYRDEMTEEQLHDKLRAAIEASPELARIALDSAKRDQPQLKLVKGE